MNGAKIFLILYIALFAFAVCVMIFGNNKCARNTFIGKIYRFFAFNLPDSINRKCRKCCGLKEVDENGEDTCMGKGGPCRYFIISFFALMYAGLVIVYLYNVFPVLDYLYVNKFHIHQVLSIIIPSIPWIIVISLQFMDPGVITKNNVENYLKKYPYDNVIYKKKMCPTDHIPVVPRSRYCNYTHRRVAKYDHYCPWVLASIGERTHRWFLLFLISCTVASFYYVMGDIRYLIIRFIPIMKKIKWTSSKAQNAMIVFLILMKIGKWLCFSIILFLVIIIMLLIFIFQQIFYITKNKTQIELDKYDYEEEVRRKNGDTRKIVNFYDKGPIQNWKEFLFPTSVPSGPEWKPDKEWKKVIRDEEIAKERKRKKEEEKARADQEKKKDD